MRASWGFGRVGRSVAAACRAFGLNVSVYDVDLQRRLDALASGFQVPERVEALKTADIVLVLLGSVPGTITMLRRCRMGLSCKLFV